LLDFGGLRREYLRDGVTVWLDVPVEDLARRVTTVGTESRPLLGEDCCDFEKALSKLTKLMDAREQHYAQAHCRLSFRGIVFLFPYQCRPIYSSDYCTFTLYFVFQMYCCT
jgi:hypothetical protein